ncbi:MAG: hypothetical protein ABW143_08460, partial [Acidimicrobiales bacterium]
MTELVALRRAARAVDTAGKARKRVVASLGFPLRAPSVPHGVDAPLHRKRTGADYETEWARTPVARAARVLIVSGPLRLVVKAVADPEVVGLDRLADLQAAEDHKHQPVIFAANHQSHV